MNEGLKAALKAQKSIKKALQVISYFIITNRKYVQDKNTKETPSEKDMKAQLKDCNEKKLELEQKLDYIEFMISYYKKKEIENVNEKETEYKIIH